MVNKPYVDMKRETLNIERREYRSRIRSHWLHCSRLVDITIMQEEKNHILQKLIDGRGNIKFLQQLVLRYFFGTTAKFHQSILHIRTACEQIA